MNHKIWEYPKFHKNIEVYENVYKYVFMNAYEFAETSLLKDKKDKELS